MNEIATEKNSDNDNRLVIVVCRNIFRGLSLFLLGHTIKFCNYTYSSKPLRTLFSYKELLFIHLFVIIIINSFFAGRVLLLSKVKNV